MSEHKFSEIQRIVIWEGYGKKCQYCNLRINYSDLHIDHIIPEKLKAGNIELVSLLAEINLSKDFNINSYYNLFPSHSKCNQRKGGSIFSKSTLLFYLEIAKSKYSNISRAEDRLRKKRYYEKLLIDISIALNLGQITSLQVSEIIKGIDPKKELNQIYYKPRFLNLEVDEYISRDKIDEMLDAKIEIGGEKVSHISLINQHKVQIKATTCRELKTAISAGFYPENNFENKMYGFFVPILGIIKALSLAETANKSFVKNIGINDINLLPVNIFPYLSHDQEEEIAIEVNEGRTIRDWVKCKQVNIVDSNRYMINLSESEGLGIKFWELIRADLNNDGFEELLVYGYSYATHGTYGWSGLYLLERRDDNSQFTFSKYEVI